MLTDRELNAIKAPKAGRLEVKVGGGLVLRVTATGAKTLGCWWRVPPKFGGPEKMGFVTFGSYPGTALARAKERAEEVLDLARKGLDPAVELRRRAEAKRVAEAQLTSLTVLAVVERHLTARRAQLRPSTLMQYDQTIQVLKASPLAARPLCEVKRGEVRETLRAIGRERKMGTARKVKTLVRAAARWAAAEDLLPHDGLAGLSFQEAEPRERDRWLSDGEIVALWKAREDAPAIMAASVRLRLILALRHPSETTGMLWTDLRESQIDGLGKVLVYEMPAERGKHGIPVSLPLPPLAVEIIEALRPSTWKRGRRSEWLESGAGAPLVAPDYQARRRRRDRRRQLHPSRPAANCCNWHDAHRCSGARRRHRPPARDQGLGTGLHPRRSAARGLGGAVEVGRAPLARPRSTTSERRSLREGLR